MAGQPGRTEAEDHDADLIGRDETLRIVDRARKSPGSTQHPIRLRLEFAPTSERYGGSLAGKVFGMQDLEREITHGSPVDGSDRLRWETLVVLIKDPAGTVRWLGSTVHGPKDDRFLYLSWPSGGEGWGMRVKIPFVYAEDLIPKIIKAERPLLSADITDRPLHGRNPVPWQVTDLGR